MSGGKIKIEFDNGDVFVGTAEPDLINGVYTYKNGDKYEGDFCGTGKNGFGKMTRSTGDVYDGEWYDDNFNGKGTIKYNGDGSIVNYFRHITDRENLILICKGDERYLQITENKKITKSYDVPFKINNFEEFSIFEKEIEINTSNLTPDEIERITCPISLEIMFDPIKTSCNHVFCKNNLTRCNENCPICRQQILYYVPDNTIIKILQKLKYNFGGKQYDIANIKVIEEIKSIVEKFNVVNFQKKKTKKNAVEKPKNKKKKEEFYCDECDASDPDDCECDLKEEIQRKKETKIKKRY
jgi:hypothetical protein